MYFTSNQNKGGNNLLDDLDERMNFSFTHDDTETPMVVTKKDTSPPAFREQRSDSFGQIPPCNNIDDELVNATVSTSTQPGILNERSIMEKHRIIKISASRASNSSGSNMRPQTGVSQRSSMSGISNTSIGGTKRDQAPNKARQEP